MTLPKLCPRCGQDEPAHLTGSEHACGGIVPSIRDYYRKPGNETGGSLHIALDDGNLTDDDLRWCVHHARERGDHDAVWIAARLLTFNQEARADLIEEARNPPNNPSNAEPK